MIFWIIISVGVLAFLSWAVLSDDDLERRHHVLMHRPDEE